VRTYDLGGNAASESQVLGPVSGLAGSGTQTFVYDAANRLLESYFGPSDNKTERRTYTYNADSNRTIVTEKGVDFYYWYDITGELTVKSPSSNPDDTGHTDFAYDPYGSLLTSQPSGPGDDSMVETIYTYDAAGHLLTIAAAGSPTVSFTLDALGRHKSQTISGAETTYAYLDIGNSVTSLTKNGVVTYSTIDALGNRLATSTPGGLGWLIPDLHGNVAAAVSSASSPLFLNAFRYDAYGETLHKWEAASGALTIPWRYQGRILESASTGTDLYDFGARSYDPSLGAFTSFDSMAGSALNPLTLNRYLYALANPATFIDPSGHCAVTSDNLDACGNNYTASVKATSDRYQKRYNAAYTCYLSGNYAAGCHGAQKTPPGLLYMSAARHADKLAAEQEAARKEAEAHRDCGPIGVGCAIPSISVDPGAIVSGVVGVGVAIATDPVGFLNENGSLIAHTTLGVGAMLSIPLISSAAALADAGLYVSEGDYTEAGLALLGAIPPISAASGRRVGQRGQKRSRGVNREIGAEREQVVVAGHQDGVLVGGQ
jgi:RHS repeat-associated protein